MDARRFGTVWSLDICRTGLFVVSRPFLMRRRFKGVIWPPLLDLLTHLLLLCCVVCAVMRFHQHNTAIDGCKNVISLAVELQWFSQLKHFLPLLRKFNKLVAISDLTRKTQQINIEIDIMNFETPNISGPILVPRVHIRATKFFRIPSFKLLGVLEASSSFMQCNLTLT